MAFDCVPGGDPRGQWCPKCARPIAESEPKTIMHFREDADDGGLSGKAWHAECARPYWETITRALDILRRATGGS